MGEDDWAEINADLERDGDWVGAKAGLTRAADDSALSARGQALENWQDEGRHAREIAAAIALDWSSARLWSVWEMALMLQWMDEPGARASAIVAVAPQTLARQGYSLSGFPKAGLDGSCAYKLTQSLPVHVDARYRPSNLSLALAHGLAVRTGDLPAAAGLAAKAEAARAALGQASLMVAQEKAGAYAGTTSYGAGANAPGWSPGSGLAAGEAGKAAQSVSSRSSTTYSSGRR